MKAAPEAYQLPALISFVALNCTGAMQATSAAELGQADLLDSVWDERYRQLYAYEDPLKTTRTLREHLRYLNSPERVRRSHGHYLVGTFKVGRGEAYVGPDALTGWYNRNLRIFSNLQRIITSPEDRILRIIGAGHLPLLRQAIPSRAVAARERGAGSRA